MILSSTRNPDHKVSLKEAILQGLAPDGGLYMPLNLPKLSEEFFVQLTPELSFPEVAAMVACELFKDEIPAEELRKMAAESYTFPVPLVPVDKHHVMELFHGPTGAFKDFAALFMSRLIAYFTRNESRERTVLVATSGDTGGAVANGFYNVPGVRVVILYPSGRVSHLQEQQLTTLGGNVKALEVMGDFDDCQRMVKEAFSNSELQEKHGLTSANSINIARLLPQSFYYFYAWAQMKPKAFCVPSGNLGNVTAGLFAKRMGLPVETFIIANNANDTSHRFFQSGELAPQETIPTVSNAMDISRPSNIERIRALYQDDLEAMQKDIFSASISDEDTLNCVKDVQNKFGYTLDPHGAVGWLALEQFGKPAVLLETAHPAKFDDSITPPDQLRACLDRTKHSIKIQPRLEELTKQL